jgi:hypothetical protein
MRQSASRAVEGRDIPVTSAAHRHCPTKLAGWVARYSAGVPGIETGGKFTLCSTSHANGVRQANPRHGFLYIYAE